MTERESMRTLISIAGAALALTFAGCEQSKTEKAREAADHLNDVIDQCLDEGKHLRGC